MFNSDVTLPAGLEISAIGKSIEFVERELSESHFIDIYLEQANLFSAIVGVFGARALDSVSNYEKHPHSHTAQQRFPDLSRRGADKDALRPQDFHGTTATTGLRVARPEFPGVTGGTVFQ